MNDAKSHGSGNLEGCICYGFHFNWVVSEILVTAIFLVRSLMHSPQVQIATPLPGSHNWAARLCCVLGVLWACAPLIHGLFHVAHVPHHHPSGYAHGGGHFAGDRLAESSDHRHGIHDHADPDEHLTPDRSSDSDQDSSPERQSPHPSPSDHDGPDFLLLEVDASSQIAFEISVPQVLPVLDCPRHSGPGFFSATIEGAARPRGPPA